MSREQLNAYIKSQIKKGAIPSYLNKSQRRQWKKYLVVKTREDRYYVARRLFLFFKLRVSRDFLSEDLAYAKLIIISGIEDTLTSIFGDISN